MKKPIIGITSAYEKEEGLKNYHRSTVSVDYSKAVVAAGGIPVIIPTLDNEEVIDEQLNLIDGLILSGGSDLNPIYFGEDFKDKMGVISPERDKSEMIILEKFMKTDKPVLGICRGHQILNVFYGGTLYQDLSYYKGDVLKHRQDLHPELEVHKVKIKEGSMLHSLYGDSVMTNSFHHQSLNKIGNGFKVVAETADGIVEAIEKDGDRFCMGIQWHPEMMVARGNKNMEKIFKLFIDKTQENVK